MPVTEIATLKLPSTQAWESPDIQAFFGAFSDKQTQWKGSASDYFQDVSDPSLIYVIRGWESVPAHYDWIASTPNQELLQLAKGLIDVESLIHIKSDLGNKVAAAPITVWTRREVGAGEIITAMEDAGVAHEDERIVCTLKGYESMDEASADLHAGGRKVVCMRRVSLTTSRLEKDT